MVLKLTVAEPIEGTCSSQETSFRRETMQRRRTWGRRLLSQSSVESQRDIGTLEGGMVGHASLVRLA